MALHVVIVRLLHRQIDSSLPIVTVPLRPKDDLPAINCGFGTVRRGLDEVCMWVKRVLDVGWSLSNPRFGVSLAWVRCRLMWVYWCLTLGLVTIAGGLGHAQMCLAILSNHVCPS